MFSCVDIRVGMASLGGKLSRPRHVELSFVTVPSMYKYNGSIRPKDGWKSDYRMMNVQS